MGRLHAETCEVTHVEGRRSSRHSNKAAARIVCSAFVALLVCGCASLKAPDRLYDTDEEMSDIRQGLEEARQEWNSARNLTGRNGHMQLKSVRNDIIMARKYSIDVYYTKYETALTREAQQLDMASRAANLALNTAGQLVPVEHTSRMLNLFGTGVGTLGDTYSDKVLRVKLLENIQASMRTARHDQAAIILSNMRCSVGTYSMAMALSDLESYYRAGTVTAGLVRLSQSVGKEEINAKAKEDGQKGANPEADARLEANKTDANMKAAAAKPARTKCKVILEANAG